MPFVSIVVPTMRVGGVDIILESAAKSQWTDFEIVIVDSLYQHRRDRIAEEARNRFLRVVHVGLNPQPNHCCFCAMSNAGIVASSGEVLLFMVDFSRIPVDLIGAHAMFHKVDPTGRAGMMGPHRYIHLDVDPKFPRYGQDEIGKYERDINAKVLQDFMWSIGKPTEMASNPHRADGGAVVPHDADPKLRLPPGPIDCSFFHAKNESVRRERVLEIDGWDQDLDGAHLYQDSDFADRLSVKGGVQWMLDPSKVVEIANPRHVFPFARRLRPHESNREIWQAKKAAGYPSTKTPLHDLRVRAESGGWEPRQQPVIADGGLTAGAKVDHVQATKKFRIAMVYGEFSSAIHGPFDLAGLYKTAGLTGSESSFFNLARTLAERGHELVAFCHCDAPFQHPSGLEILPIRIIPEFHKVGGVDFIIAWNEPDYLTFAPAGAKRIVDQQLNDWGYCRVTGWRDLVDRLVFPSESSRQHHLVDEKLTKAGMVGSVIPNSVDLDLFAGAPPSRNPHRVVYCSSPDRGLHHLLGLWPLVRKQIPDAELKIFYRLDPWLARVRDMPDEVGRRARYIEASLPRLQRMGVEVIGPVPNIRMAEELRSAAALAYPCDPVSYTEGFGCSVLDAAAGGCVPIISDADALPSVHKEAALVIKGNPGDGLQREAWTETIVSVLRRGAAQPEWQKAMDGHALAHSRQAIAMQWEELLVNS